MKKVVVAGATSMIGVALIQECIQNNIQVLAIVRKNSKNLYRIPKSALITLVECNLDEFESLVPQGDTYDVFYHLAWGFTDPEKRKNPELQERNVKYTLDAVNVAHRLGCYRFIGAGSQAEYGMQSDKIGPDTCIHPDSAYGIAKYAAGQLSRLQCNQLGMQHIWARVFSVYGPYDHPDTMIMYAIRSFLKGEKASFTKAEQKWDYLYCKDAARAFYLIGKKGKGKSIYCVGSGETRPLAEYIKSIHHEIGQPSSIGLGEKEYANQQIMYLCADIVSLAQDTGFQPLYSFEEGIKETIDWVKTMKTITEEEKTNL